MRVSRARRSRFVDLRGSSVFVVRAGATIRAEAVQLLSISVVARVEDGQDDRLLQWARNSAGSTRIERAPQAFAVLVMLRPGASDRPTTHEVPRQQIELVDVELAHRRLVKRPRRFGAPWGPDAAAAAEEVAKEAPLVGLDCALGGDRRREVVGARVRPASGALLLRRRRKSAIVPVLEAAVVAAEPAREQEAVVRRRGLAVRGDVLAALVEPVGGVGDAAAAATTPASDRGSAAQRRRARSAGTAARAAAAAAQSTCSLRPRGSRGARRPQEL